MIVFKRFFGLFFSVMFFFSCHTEDSIKDVDPAKDPAASHTLDTITRPSVTDSIHLWIVPNHMLWIPLEFEDPHYQN